MIPNEINGMCFEFKPKELTMTTTALNEWKVMISFVKGNVLRVSHSV